MIKLKLCKQCDITSECETYCREANEFEKQDNSKNYIEKGSYKALNTIKSTYPDARQSGGFGHWGSK